MNIFKTCILFLAIALSLVSCNDSDKDRSFSVVAIMSTNSFGDSSQNEYVNVLKSGFSECDVVPFEPETLDDAEEAFVNWLNENDEKSLMVLASSQLEYLADKYLADGNYDHLNVLLFESRNTSTSANTFCIEMYGAGYLAGCVAANIDGQSRFLAMCGDSSDTPVVDGGMGFLKGCTDSGVSSSNYDLVCLADDATGYSMYDEVKLDCETYFGVDDYTFIYPLAGISNYGVYDYLNDNPTVNGYTAGLDADLSEVSDKIAFSVVKHIDQIVAKYIVSWLLWGYIEPQQTFTLESGMIEVILSPSFDTEKYQTILEDNLSAAISAENAIL